MNKKEFFKFQKDFYAKAIEITKQKNADYSHKETFGNFKNVERLGICKAEIGFLTRMTDKLCRVNSFIQRGDLKVKDESVQDTLTDLANYSCLLAGYLKSKK